MKEIDFGAVKEQKHVVRDVPPNWTDIIQAFPIVAEAKDRVVFTFYPNIYVPGEKRLPPDVYVHETVHLKQQEAYGVEKWWDQYIYDPVFRLEQELEAYGVQLALYNDGRSRVFEYMKDRLAQDLSSEFYGRLISFGEAASKIRRIAKSLTLTFKTENDEKETA